jgi:gliding motility-associated-like protein
MIPEGTEIAIDLGPDLTIQVDDTYQLQPLITSAGPIDSLVWNPSILLSCDHCTHPIINTTLADTFMISATVYSGGCIATDALLVNIYDRASIYVPNVFSPNGDGINDYFTIYSSDPFANIIEIEIFDRWGELVFYKTNFPVNQMDLGWDGQFKGRAMNPGVFVCVATVRLSTGSLSGVYGDLTLVR